MKKQLFAILMFALALAVPAAYAAPPDQLIAYAAQNEQIAKCAHCHGQPAQIEDTAHQKTSYKFETTPAVMLVPAGQNKLSALVNDYNEKKVVVRGDHAGTVRGAAKSGVT